jgi:hypothetical protein
MVFITECYKDKEFLHRIGFTPDQVIHEFGRSSVLSKVEQEIKAIGIIDEDPDTGKPEYLRNYKVKNAKGKIALLIRKDDDGSRIIRRIILVSPYFENWLFYIAKRSKISPNTFNLPDNPEELHSLSLKIRENAENFRKFISTLLRKQDPEIATFTKWLKEAL